MRRTRVTSTVDRQVLAEGEYPNRSLAIESAVRERIERLRRSRLARECAKLDPKEEQALANEQYAAEVDWPEYPVALSPEPATLDNPTTKDRHPFMFGTRVE